MKSEVLNLRLKPNITELLEEVAFKTGRCKTEIIRGALIDWLRKEGFLNTGVNNVRNN